MSDLISREATIERIEGMIPHLSGDKRISADVFIRFLKSRPAVDAEPVRHGGWKWFEEWLPSTTVHYAECDDCGWQCSECKNALRDMVGGYWDNPDEKPKLNYCPNCGARMDMEVSGDV